MPVIPQIENTEPYPGAPAMPAMNPQTSSDTAEALARGTAGMSDEFSAFAGQYAQQKRAVAASDGMIGVDNQLGDLALQWSKAVNPATGKPDMDYSVNGFNDAANQVRQQALKGVQDPGIANMLSQRIDEARIVHSSTVRTNAFGLEASDARGTLDAQLAQLAGTAANAPTDVARAQALDDGDRAIASRSPVFLAPEEAAKERLMFRSNVQKIRAMDFMKTAAEDPSGNRLSPLAISNAILDQNNFQGLLPAEREQLADQAIRLGRTIVSMRMADEAHTDAMAQKALTRTQAATAADLIAKGNTAPPGQNAGADPGTLAGMVKSQLLSEAGFSAVLAAQAKRDAGRDDAATVTDLWRRAGQGEDVTHEALEGYTAGTVARATVVELERAVDARTKGGESAVDKANFATLKTALNGYAVEQGVFAGTDKADKAALWTQGQTEWTRRVLSGNEKSGAALQDMLSRYVKAPPSPDGLPSPRLGAVSSLQDVAKVWAATKGAHAAGRLNDAQFDAETRLLNQYQQAFTDAQAAKAAAGGKSKSQSLGPSGDQ